MSYEHRPKKVNMLSRNLGESKKVSLSNLAFGDLNYGLVTQNSFVEINEKREINNRQYTELMKKNRIKVKIRTK